MNPADTMSAILVFGFLLGMRHAIETDHVAAVATLVARSSSHRRAVFQGAVWGLGHTVTLFLAGSVVLFLDTVIPEQLAHGLETAVGVMLILLGGDLIRRMLRDRVHFHSHRHADGTVHFHAHSHAGQDRPHAQIHHEHEHARFPARALYVGLMHGLAGSAALILLTLSTVDAPAVGLLYIALFGVGSIGGMAALSVVISVPLHGARRFTWLHNGIQTAVGVVSIAVGISLFYASGLAILS